MYCVPRNADNRIVLKYTFRWVPCCVTPFQKPGSVQCAPKTSWWIEIKKVGEFGSRLYIDLHNGYHNLQSPSKTKATKAGTACPNVFPRIAIDRHCVKTCPTDTPIVRNGLSQLFNMAYYITGKPTNTQYKKVNLCIWRWAEFTAMNLDLLYFPCHESS